MENLSWLYYKGYYKGFQHWNNIKPGDENAKKQINSFFQVKNDSFTKAILSDFKNIKLPNPKNGNSSFKLKTIYPGLLLGSGYSHGIGAIGEFKIGFQLDYVSGLPIIPGSSVKGVIRSAFPIIEINMETKKLDFGTAKATDREREKEKVKAKWILSLLENINEIDFLSKTIQPKEINTDDKIDYFYKLIAEVFEGVRDIKTEKPELRFFSIYKRNIFFEAIPIKSEHTGNLLYGDDSITPHQPKLLKNPIPLLFLKVLPNVVYKFNFRLFESTVEPILTEKKLKLLFQKILLTLGIGAKTNVGYGQFVIDIPNNNYPKEAEKEKSKQQHKPKSDKQVSYNQVMPMQNHGIKEKSGELNLTQITDVQITNTWKDLAVGAILEGELISYNNGNSNVLITLERKKIELNFQGKQPAQKNILLKVLETSGKFEKGNLKIIKVCLFRPK